MEFNPLYLKYLFLAQCFCVSLGLIEGGTKFTRKNQPVTFECPLEKQNLKHWRIDRYIISRTAKTEYFEANVLPNNVRIINITLLQNIEQIIVCESTTGEKTRFHAKPLFTLST
ncbi:uncharacterized protein LOC118761327 [Octopus sinensis]|uniref:Uncharacterized protein LOC118761327 n=1 Tax=Octopus sinensis TaxID=2607531 RepID=A0A7E6EIA4_9MOLL|nr:uncharacterized protein LOC118761327 [Octopus sinensis]